MLEREGRRREIVICYINREEKECQVWHSGRIVTLVNDFSFQKFKKSGRVVESCRHTVTEPFC